MKETRMRDKEKRPTGWKGVKVNWANEKKNDGKENGEPEKPTNGQETLDEHEKNKNNLSDLITELIGENGAFKQILVKQLEEKEYDPLAIEKMISSMIDKDYLIYDENNQFLTRGGRLY